MGLAQLARRWGGCVSFGVSVCDRVEWECIAAEWARVPLARSFETLHSLVSDGTTYAFNAARNAAAELFAAFSSAARSVWGAPQRTPLRVLDSFPSSPEPAVRAILRAAAMPGCELYSSVEWSDQKSLSVNALSAAAVWATLRRFSGRRTAVRSAGPGCASG